MTTVYIRCLETGEIQEGQVWEASMLAAHRKLDNLVVIVDNNNLQIDGAIDEVNSPYPIDQKFEAFNFHVINIDGHDFDAIDAAFKEPGPPKDSRQLLLQRQSKEKEFPSWKPGFLARRGSERRDSMRLLWQT